VYEELGCYGDKGGKKRPLPKLVINLRPDIDWQDLKNSVIEVCAKKVKEKGSVVHSIVMI
jgi:hypothetical protein